MFFPVLTHLSLLTEYLFVQRIIHPPVGWLNPCTIPEVNIKPCMFFFLDDLIASIHLFYDIMVVKGYDAHGITVSVRRAWPGPAQPGAEVLPAETFLPD